jgi:lipopolysaccharide export system protein LptC
MKARQGKVQLILLTIGLSLIILTYFYYPSLNKENKIVENQTADKIQKNEIGKGQFSTFENVEYQGLTSAMQEFSVNSESAYMLDEDPDLVFMKSMRVQLYLNDGRVVVITSDKGRYQKQSHDCWFEKNVVADDGETKIFAENLDLLATENFVKIYKQVKLFHPTGSLEADQIDYDFEKKYFKVSMFGEKSVKMKVLQ